MLILGLFLYWLIGVISVSFCWTKKNDLTSDILFITSILWWVVWPAILLISSINWKFADKVIVSRRDK